MPLRSSISIQHDRPSSAIYIGNSALNPTTSTSATTSTQRRPPSISSIPPSLPDLPEPPSPVLSSSSGLPSPPATNSTGSGSAGDPISATNTGPRRPLTYTTPNTRKNPTGRISRHSISSVGDPGVEGDGDPLDEDHTARFRSAALGRHAKTAAASGENVVTLQRVKSLAERNKLALDKLTVMARLTPPSTRNSQASSPVSSPSSPSSSGRSRNRTSLPPPPQEQPLSGSETERESFYTHYTNISSPSLSHMANSAQTSTATYQTPPPRSNHHRIASLSSASVSTPYLPSTSRVFQTPPPHAQPLTKTWSTGGSNTTPSSGSGSRTRLTLASTSGSSTSKSKEDKPTTGSPKRRRISGSGGSVLTAPSVASTSSEVNGEDPRSQVRRNNAIREEETDVVQAALAAVASSRSSNSLDVKRRHVLPREHRRDEVVVEDDYPADPVTPYRYGGTASQLRSIDREKAERGKGKERREIPRGGSAESALASSDLPRRTTVREALKALGFSPKRNRTAGRERERGGREFLDDDVFEERARSGELVGRRPSPREQERDPMGLRSATSLSHRRYSSRSRSRTANISDDEDSDGKENDIMRTAPAGLRSYRHTYITPQEPERDSVHLSLMKKERERERERGRDIITGRSMTSLSKYTAMSTPVHAHQTGSSSSVVSGNLPQQGAASYSSRRGSTQIMSNHTGNTAGGDSERAASRLSALVPIERTEHARLMADSFSMFEGHMARMLSSEGSALNSVYISELVRAAQGVVSSADRLNALLRSASKNAVDMEIDAEVADDIEAETGGRGNAGMYSAKDMVHVWKRVNADYKDGVKASDELVRGITSFLLGIGKVLRDVGSDGASVASSASVASTSSHMRSISLNDEDIIRSTIGSSPSLSDSSGAGRRSVDVGRRTWETSPHVTAVAAAAAENPREEAYRRLTMMRPSSSSRPRERDQDVRYESPLTAHPSQHEFVTPASLKSSRRLLMPREQREQEREERLSRMSSSEDLVASTSQDTIVPCDPSPSPAPRIRDSFHKPLPPLSIPKALPSLPSASSSRQQNRSPEQDYNDLLEEASNRGHERRKASNASLSTIRAASIHSSYSTYPAVLNPSGGGATTAVTAHTVSNSTPESTPSISSSSVLSSAESRRNLRSIITFSRPSTESVPTLAGLQQQYEERQRSTTNEVRTSVPPPPSTPMSGSETERPPKRQTWGARTGQLARGMTMADAGSVDDFGRMSLGRAADRSAASSFSTRKERRTVTELFQRS